MKAAKRILSIILCLSMVIGYFTFGISAEETQITDTLVSKELGYENAALFTSATFPQGKITITMDKATGGTAPAYYNSGEALRLYGKNVLTISPAEGGSLVLLFLP